MANQRPRGAVIWWRKWAKKDWAISAVGVTIIVITLAMLLSDSGGKKTVNTSPSAPTSDLVDLTISRTAKNRGALCLDGSLPGYHFQRGSGSGSSNWLLHIEGGGWCNTVASCSSRKTTPLGSSKYMERQVFFDGILSSNVSKNPDFYNWNKVKVRYCDGASFSGRPEGEFQNGTKLFFRGQLIWEAIMVELLSLGLAGAKEALLSGCSAGGLATLIHCDEFRGKFPKDATVKCLADAGFFLNEEDVSGRRTIESFYHDVVQLQGLSKSLQKDCVANIEPYKCFFPQEFVKYIKTPLFVVSPSYDWWQIQNVLVPDASDPHGDWQKCKMNIHNCNTRQLDRLQEFRNALLKSLSSFQQNKEGGLFINSCFIHCQTWFGETWHSPSSPRINNKTIAESVADWYFNRKVVKQIDCPYPCNPTCYNIAFT